MLLSIPLAERLRPTCLEDYIGQKHITGEGAVLRNTIEQGNIPSMILWGPPGTGKTTLANIIANKLNRPFFTLSAISSGVKDIREVIDKSQQTNGAVLFIDEIHRFNKAQQDSLLGAVEKGTITLIGATTENPSFEVITPLLSRCQVYVLKELSADDLITMLERGRMSLENNLGFNISIKEHEALLRLSGGDARKLLNTLELVVNADHNGDKIITNEKVLSYVQQHIAMYDKNGEQHYDIISAFIKSIRGSDPNAAVYWLARMIAGGEDPKFIARRLVILASEDIGNANPNALLLANTCFDAVNKIGFPESRIILSQTTIYLATSAKSNASYEAINAALSLVKQTGDLPVPLHIRNAPTKLMKELNYGKDYKYAHAYDNNFAAQEFMPEKIKNTKLYSPQKNASEEKIREKMRELWGKKYGY